MNSQKYTKGQIVKVKIWDVVARSFSQRPGRIIGVNFYDNTWNYEVQWLDTDPKNSLQSKTQGSLTANLITL